ncbi:NAD(P)-binding protein [Streptomyces luteolifulvus]|uniref:NAD(P)-binding protein n=1 Tax=Streptomyces luteolifulvus TaxID=2615112 RepID=A0A6H9UYS1_9ACTN|nr:NAD(P)/FAD-dependent oxidoreductase [Streptomyces luteolifulvus]KAB1144956.1 NAD(P)-binding protein [Streptomyces luteolifulvus]
MTERPHLAVIGAGPAGLAATVAAAAHGLRVTLLDSAAQAGGQFYRQPADGLRARRPQALHHQWRTWERLRDALDAHVKAGHVRHLTDHHVWCVERGADGFTVHALLGPEQEEPVSVPADAVLLATGGYEKVLPFPGWTLPGVLTAGGAQAMLKGTLAVSGRTAVVAGTGPLLLPVAAGLAAAGVKVAALVESAGPRAFLRRTGALAAQPGKLAEGAGYAARLARHRVRLLGRHTVVEAHGAERGGSEPQGRSGGEGPSTRRPEGPGTARLSTPAVPGTAGLSTPAAAPGRRTTHMLAAVTVAALDAERRVRPGTQRRIPCDTLAVGHGMLAHTDLAESLGCRLEGTGVRVDDEQRTDVPGVWAAGETTGIGGAALALAEGHIAGRSVAARLHGHAPDPRTWAAAAKTRTRLRAFSAALDAVYAPPAHWAEQITDDTVVCRCEEVTAGAVREAVGELGAGDLRTVKLLTRAGMGWCQGRVCAPAVAGLAGCELTPSRRPFARPVPLGVLAHQHTHPTGRGSS